MMFKDQQVSNLKKEENKDIFSGLDFGEQTIADLDSAEEEFKKVHEAEKDIKTK